ncbi:hypothetical protein VNI00_016207 [Paramarasmius palmivorus]|uniref:Ribonuclease H1 N-terminal domain-containing protein n=1 Tax=Paramarasmius palmivorus TaxID=297713 RepID=A0AAW0BDU4_9AGAR
MNKVEESPGLQPDYLLSVFKSMTGLGTISGLCNTLSCLNDDQTQVVNAILSAMVMKDYLLKHIELNHAHTVINPGAADVPATLILHCHKCNEPVTMPPPESRWYAVFAGTRIGWVRGWDKVKMLVLHVPGNKYSSYKTMEDARKAFIYAFFTRHVEVTVLDNKPFLFDPIPQTDGMLFP